MYYVLRVQYRNKTENKLTNGAGCQENQRTPILESPLIAELEIFCWGEAWEAGVGVGGEKTVPVSLFASLSLCASDPPAGATANSLRVASLSACD